MAIQFMGGFNAGVASGQYSDAMFVDTDTGLPAKGYEHLTGPVAVTTPAIPPIILPSPTAPSPSAVSKSETVKICKGETFNVISLAKKRKRFLEGEIKRLRVLEKEHLELTRLLEAAARPVAIVHNIQRKNAVK